MSKLITTSYVDPDLDGVACAIAYAEFLQATSRSAEAFLMGQPTVEAEFVLEHLRIPRPTVRTSFEPEEEVIILDASEPIHFEGRLIPEQVVEVIDHRKVNEGHLFTKAKIQIELVGAAATLVAEKFRDQKVVPTESTAQLLQSAIFSNTQNFQAKTTTDRDHDILKWLADIAPLPDGFVHDMFAVKSDFSGDKLAKAMDIETAIFEMAGKRLGIVQLEMVGSEALMASRVNDVRAILKHLQEQNTLSFIFLTALDIEAKVNRFVVIDADAQAILEKALGLAFINGIAVREGIIMRKEMAPLIKGVM